MRGKLATVLMVLMAVCAGAIFGCGEDSSGGDPTTSACTKTGAFSCTGTVEYVCSVTQQWVRVKDCADEGLICQNGLCVQGGGCTSGQKACTGGVKIVTCNESGTWEQTFDCSTLGQACNNGLCAGCTSGTYRCSPSDSRLVEYCQTDGEWAFNRQCSTGDTCSNGTCVPSGADGDADPTDSKDVIEEVTGPACSDSEPCGDSTTYCFMEKDATAGVCIEYCSSTLNNCPYGYSCNLTLNQCVIIEGFCTRNSQCGQGRYCDILSGVDYGTCKIYCYIPGNSCPESTRCCKQTDTAAECEGYTGKCRATQQACTTCYTDNDCGQLYFCEKATGQNIGCCYGKCTSDADCPGDLTCSSKGRCGLSKDDLSCASGCPTGYICDATLDQCVLNCPQCSPDSCCDAASAPNCYVCKCTNPEMCGPLMDPCCWGYSCNVVFYNVYGYCI